jgi:hypothetical protein
MDNMDLPRKFAEFGRRILLQFHQNFPHIVNMEDIMWEAKRWGLGDARDLSNLPDEWATMPLSTPHPHDWQPIENAPTGKWDEFVACNPYGRIYYNVSWCEKNQCWVCPNEYGGRDYPFEHPDLPSGSVFFIPQPPIKNGDKTNVTI